MLIGVIKEGLLRDSLYKSAKCSMPWSTDVLRRIEQVFRFQPCIMLPMLSMLPMHVTHVIHVTNGRRDKELTVPHQAIGETKQPLRIVKYKMSCFCLGYQREI